MSKRKISKLTTFFNHQKNFLNTSQKIYLHKKYHELSQIILTSNSGLFDAWRSIKYHLIKDGLRHSDVTIILTPFWLDKVHSDYYSLPWGQSPSQLPLFFREEFFEIFPKHPINEKITWGQYITLREYIIKKLLDHVQLYRTSSTEIEIKKNLDEYLIKFDSHTLRVSKTSHFYELVRVPNLDHKLQFSENTKSLQGISHVELYTKPSKEIESQHAQLIGIGDGRSAIWLANHFSNIIIANIVNKDYPLLHSEKKPDNLIPYLQEDFDKKLYVIETNGKKISIINQRNNSKFTGENLYCMMGFIPLTLTKEVNPSQVTHGGITIPHWNAPQELPIGSLSEITCRWALLTENPDWIDEPAYFYDIPIKTIIEKIEESGLTIDCKFFDSLKYEITHTNSLTQEETIEKYKFCYQKSHPNVTESDLKKLENVLLKYEENRLQEHRDIDKEFTTRYTKK